MTTATAPLEQMNARTLYNNRELSWLDFNFRVLAEAQNPDVPLAERVKFLAITSGNLDEFFMVRVALMHRAHAAGSGPTGPDERMPEETLAAIAEKAHEMVDRQSACFEEEVMPGLAERDAYIVAPDAYTAADRDFLSSFFEEQIFPVLTPLAVDPSHPFPLVASCAVYTLFKIKPIDGVSQQLYGQTDTVLVQVPTGLKRLVPLPAEKGQVRAALLDDIITRFAEKLLGGYSIEGAYSFRVTRDADIEVDDESADNLMQAIEERLRERRRGAPVRLEVLASAPDEIVDYLQQQLELEDQDTYRIRGMLDMKSLFQFLGMLKDKAGLFDPRWLPQPHPVLGEECDIFAAMRERDHCLHHPYQAFDPVLQLVSQAAGDPNVLAIKITLYRVSGDSPLVESLVRAAESGKQVTVLVELRARFDEEANIHWARRLDHAGAHVIYGVVGYKTHSKVLLVVRRESDGIRRYVHLSTGNYNDSTAKLYTDIGYLTARPEFGADISAYFNVITGYSLPPAWNRIEMAPTGMRRKFLALIEREIEKHSSEKPGFIRAKMNSCIDPEVIQALYRASQAGVKIDLLVRGLCRLRARVPGLSDNIRVFSILDRFLEHPRIYHFHNGGNEEVYCASADWMERNFDRRLELLFPIIDPEAQQTVLTVLNEGLADNVKAWEMQPDGGYTRVQCDSGEKARRSQGILYDLAKQQAKSAKRPSKTHVFKAKTAKAAGKKAKGRKNR